MENWQLWRKQQRERLVAERMAADDTVRAQWSDAISGFLQQGFVQLQTMKIGLYWPFRGEYDPRRVVRFFWESGASLALPEVVEKHQPLHFREWWPDAPMTTGAYAIPVPHGTRRITPDALIIPMVGFDRRGYRLGYGSGYFDRTLAAFAVTPLTIGVAFEMQRLDDVYPQQHDIAMQYVVTEAGVFQREGQALKLISAQKRF